MKCTHYEVTGYASSFVVNLKGRTFREVVEYLAQMFQVQPLTLGGRLYVNAESPQGRVHARFE